MELFNTQMGRIGGLSFLTITAMNPNLLLASLLNDFGGGLFLMGQAFWLWMLIDCMKSEGPRSEWRYVLFFGNIAGAIAYFIVRWLPNNDLPLPPMFSRWKYQQKLWNAKAAVHNIGNPHQFALLGDVHLEMGDLGDAQRAYERSIEREPKNEIALWGIARIAMKTKDFSLARIHLNTLLQVDPAARLGDASLLYGKALFELQDWKVAKTHLERDLRQWSHPESSLLLSKILIQEGNTQEARDRLESMLSRIQASPMYHHRRHQSSIRIAKKLLKTL